MLRDNHDDEDDGYAGRCDWMLFFESNPGDHPAMSLKMMVKIFNSISGTVDI